MDDHAKQHLDFLLLEPCDALARLDRWGGVGVGDRPRRIPRLEAIQDLGLARQRSDLHRLDDLRSAVGVKTQPRENSRGKLLTAMM